MLTVVFTSKYVVKRLFKTSLHAHVVHPIQCSLSHSPYMWGRVTPLTSPPSLHGDIEKPAAAQTGHNWWWEGLGVEMEMGRGGDVGRTQRAKWAHEDSNVIWLEWQEPYFFFYRGLKGLYKRPRLRLQTEERDRETLSITAGNQWT